MQLRNDAILFSATDVVGYLECEHLTSLDLRNLYQPVAKAVDDESAALIARKGDEHERAYLARLRGEDLQVIDISEHPGSIDEKELRTLAAMGEGVEVIYQATLRDGPLIGHADFLRKSTRPSALGEWSYEVVDTKLARSPKAKFLVQLAFYSRLLTSAQGVQPEKMHVVLGDQSQRSFRTADYAQYFETVLDRFLARVQADDATAAPTTYPTPCSHCDLCGWRDRCASQRHSDDHLSQVANIMRSQYNKLEAGGVKTMAALANLPDGVSIQRLNGETLRRLQSQAALQVEARTSGTRHLVLLPEDPDLRRGFSRLPPPDAGDMYFDMEGNPLEDGGLEYLFGVSFRDAHGWRFQPFWAHSRVEERRAFESFVDFVAARRRAFPAANVYHYASYEETALKRLAMMHATREVEIDDLLRAGALVDLYKVVREGLRISEPSYSIKYVEHFYRSKREGGVQNAGASIVFYERWRETGMPTLLKDIEDYNRDDVESTQQLHEWLLTLRPGALPWRNAVAVDGASEDSSAPKSEKASMAEQRLVPYRKRLVDELPSDTKLWTEQQHLDDLCYQLLDFHRRSAKPEYWALFSRMDMSVDELIDDAECLGGLTLDPGCPPYAEKRSIVYTYLAPEQETKLSSGAQVTRTDTGRSVGSMIFDEQTRRVQLKLGPSNPPLPSALSIGPGGPINTASLVEAIFRFVGSRILRDGRYAALEDLLQRRLPRLKKHRPGQPLISAGEHMPERSLAVVEAMDDTWLYVQGPPGSGKTYTGSRMIARLLSLGKRVGIMSNSHKAINNLLAGAVGASRDLGLGMLAVKKATRGASEYDDEAGGVENVYDNADVWRSNAALIAGTAWLFADMRGDQQLDYLFIDEAGQVALANVVAAGTCARNIVLLGDQMQLSQPVKGSHPGRSGDSALDYLLDGAATISPERGIFLATSWRMHPDVCAFISEAMYEGRLLPEATNLQRELKLQPNAHALLRPSGIVHVSLDHEGCSQQSEAEALLVRDLYESALMQTYSDRTGELHAMTASNILVVAPYNVQVNLLKRTLPLGARVGTVDKFQGQEAELVILSMTTSSEEELPRNIEFLFSRNRLNVGISRAKCTAVVVANSALTAIRCKTPEQMALVNTLCWMKTSGTAPRH